MRSNRTRAVAALSSFFILLTFVPAVSASVPILEWTEVDTPGDNDLIVVTPSEVTGIAAGDNGIVYAIDGENGRLYRSLEYSLDWEDFTRYLEDADATLPATMIAVAPDNEGIVAVLTDNGTAVYVSLNGGYDWENVQLPVLSGEVTALAISEEYRVGDYEYREIAVGTASWGDDLSNGEVYVLQGGCGWSYWEAQELTVDEADPVHIGADVATLAYSPDYSRDDTLLVVCSTGSEASLNDGPQDNRNKTFLCLGERDVDNGGTAWGFLSPDYPIEIIDAGDAVGVSYLRSTLALPSEYYSGESDERTVFLSIERDPDYDDDVYRVVGDTVERMEVDGGSDIEIWSIAYRGNLKGGILLAGERKPTFAGALNTQVWRTTNPVVDSPQIPDWGQSTVPPTGPGNAVLAWAPDVSLAYCGTSSQPGVALDESAFSAGTYGDLWRQMALIDTEFTLTDLAVTPDGKDLFLTTANQWGPESVWQSYTDPLGEWWERVLTIDSDTEAVMLKLSPAYDDDGTIYAIEHNGDKVALTHDGGDTWDWQRKSPEPILDFVIVDEDTLYAAIPDGMVMKSTNYARSWEDPVETGLDDVNMLSLALDGTLFVGGRDGYVAYSTDGAESFVLLDEEKPVGSGDVQVLADVEFEENGWVYAATIEPDEGLWRWKLGVYDDWEQMDGDITLLNDGQQVGGLIQGPEGTLYALRTEPASDDTGGMTRWLCPTCAPCADLEYDHVIEGLPDDATFSCVDAFATTYPVRTLWSNDVETDVFAIDSAIASSDEQHIFLFRDTLCKRGPNLETPEDGTHLDINACSCNRDAVVAFDWEEFDEVDLYEWKVYLDASPSEPLWNTFSDYEGLVVSPTADTTDFLSGMRYGWNVRSSEPYLSPWSHIWTFTPILCPVESLVPDIGSTEVSTSPVFTWNCSGAVDGYEFMLAVEPSYAEPIASFSDATILTDGSWACDIVLDTATNYFWRVRAVRGDAIGSWVEGSFRTVSATVESSGVPSATTVDVPPQSSGVGDYLIWGMFVLAVVLFLGVIVLIMRTARRY
ncbi:MAG: hypothetical protein JW846_01435 [Dehalococcoidia bacterium]|nr:hypothetical protein [Dehalococcoidia bacterium]